MVDGTECCHRGLPSLLEFCFIEAPNKHFHAGFALDKVQEIVEDKVAICM
jgi:hypothetical protein